MPPAVQPMRLNITGSNNKRFRSESDSEAELQDKRAKIYHGNGSFEGHSLLHLFVDYAWEASFGKRSMSHTVQLVYWLSSQNIDFNSRDWYSPEAMAIWESRNQSISAKLARALRFVLPALMRSNGDVEYVDEFGQTILHVFLKNYMWNPQPALGFELKWNKIVAALLLKGASVDRADEFGNTPFGIAAAGLRRDLCWMMLPYFYNVDACDVGGDTALHKICGKFYQPNVWSDIVRVLLSKGADPNGRNNEGLTPVHLAAENGKSGFLRIFAQSGADFSLRAPNGETSLMLYCRNERNELLVQTVELLLTDDCDVGWTDERGFSAIHYATRHGANAVVDRLSKFRADKLRGVAMNVTVLSVSLATDDDDGELLFSESFDTSIETA